MTDDGAYSDDEAAPAVEREAGEWIADALAGMLDDAADATGTAAALAHSWVMIEDALGPILGSRSVAALYKRSLQLSSAAHDWLLDLQHGSTAAIDLAALEAAFAGRSDREAIAAARGILRTFSNLMVGLVGLSLTERLLRPVLPHVPPR